MTSGQGDEQIDMRMLVNSGDDEDGEPNLRPLAVVEERQPARAQEAGAVVIPAAEGHAWRYWLVGGANHQYKLDAEEDSAGIVKTACRKDTMAFQVYLEAAPQAPYCPDCLRQSPARELADALEAAAQKIAAQRVG